MNDLIILWEQSVALAGNVLQLYLVADFENENFKFRQNEIRKRKY